MATQDFIDTTASQADDSPFQTLEWRPASGEQPEALLLLDQLLLPHKIVMVVCPDYEAVGQAIKTMQIRGAPALGVAGAYGMALAARRSAAATPQALLAELEVAGKHLFATRPSSKTFLRERKARNWPGVWPPKAAVFRKSGTLCSNWPGRFTPTTFVSTGKWALLAKKWCPPRGMF